MNSSILLFLCAVFLQISIHECTDKQIKELPRRTSRKSKRLINWVWAPAIVICRKQGKCTGPSPFKCYECDCFPATANIILDNGKSVTMSDLQIGDQVQTVSPDGIITYSKVKAFLEKDYIKIGRYKAITTACNKTVTLSRTHLIYGRKKCTDKFKPQYADQVSIGDEILLESNDEMIPVKVLNVSYIMKQGAYVPLTVSGNIVVDGVLASCFSSYDHDLAYFAMTPMHLFPGTMGWIFGEDYGSSGYAEMAKEFAKWMFPADQSFKAANNRGTVN